MRVKNHFAILGFLAVFTAFAPAVLAQAAKETVGGQDRAFIVGEAGNQLMDLKLGELATGRAASREVKNFGRSAASDQAEINKELRLIAKKKGVTVFSEMPEKNIGYVTRLSGISGENFDRQYISLALEEYAKELEDFRREAGAGQDPDLRSFAAKNVPLLEKKLARANEISHKLGGPVPGM